MDKDGTETGSKVHETGSDPFSGAVAAAGRSAHYSKTSASPTVRLNDRTALVAVAIIVISAIPLGSNRPFFWAFWSLVLSGVLFVYLFSLARIHAEPRRLISQFPLPAMLFAATGIWMFIQILPIGILSGGVRFETPMGTSIYSNTLSLAPNDTLLALLKWLSYGVLFYLFVQIGARKNRARKISIWLMLFVTAEALFGFFSLLYLGDTVLFAQKNQYQGDLTGTFINRNSFATFLAMGSVLAAALAIPSSAGTKAGRTNAIRFTSSNVVAVACLAIIVMALIATNSRMGSFAGFVGISLVIILRLSSWHLRIAVICLIAIAGVASLVSFGDELFNRLLFVEKNALDRLAVYRQVVSMILDRPFLGFGADTFRAAYPLYKAPPVITFFTFDRAHSTYLANWSELGVLFGTLPPLIMVVLQIKIIRHMLRTGTRSVETCAALGVITTTAIHSLVDFSLEIEAVLFLMLAIVGLSIGEAMNRGMSSTGGKPGHKERFDQGVQ